MASPPIRVPEIIERYFWIVVYFCLTLHVCQTDCGSFPQEFLIFVLIFSLDFGFFCRCAYLHFLTGHRIHSCSFSFHLGFQISGFLIFLGFFCLGSCLGFFCLGSCLGSFCFCFVCFLSCCFCSCSLIPSLPLST